MVIENTEDLKPIFTPGTELTDELLREAALTLPENLAITFATAGEVGLFGLFGGEFTRMSVYSYDGSVTSITSGAVTAGTPGLPGEFVGELGIANVGADAGEALDGFSLTVEAGFVVGVGLTVPIETPTAIAREFLDNINHTDINSLVDAVSTLPEGSVLFFSSGAQASAGGEISYSVEDGNWVLRSFGNPDYDGVGIFSGAEYSSALHYVEDNRGPARISWDFEEGGVTYTVLQSFDKVRETRDGVTLANFRTAISVDGESLSASQVRAFGFEPRTTLIPISNGGFVDREQCFPAGTLIDMWPTHPGLPPERTSREELMSAVWQKPIEDIAPSDLVLAFDSAGSPVPGKVDRLFTNTTSEFVRLTFADGQEPLTTTPGHRFLAETGDYMEIEHLLRLGGGVARLTQADGTILEARGEMIAFSAETAALFAQAQARTMAKGGNLLEQDQTAPGWQIYNFEVRTHHNYVAGGIRVHNDSILANLEDGDRLVALNDDLTDAGVLRDVNGDGTLDFVTLDGYRPEGSDTLLSKTRIFEWDSANGDLASALASVVASGPDAASSVENPEGSTNGWNDGAWGDDIEEAFFDDVVGRPESGTPDRATIDSLYTRIEFNGVPIPTLEDILLGAVAEIIPVPGVTPLSDLMAPLLAGIETVDTGNGPVFSWSPGDGDQVYNLLTGLVEDPAPAPFALAAVSLQPEPAAASGGDAVVLDILSWLIGVDLNQGLDTLAGSIGLSLPSLPFGSYPTLADALGDIGLPEPGGDATLTLGDGIAAGDISQAIDGSDLILTIDNGDGTTSTITLAGAVVDGEVQGLAPIELADGSTLGLSDIPQTSNPSDNTPPVSVADDALVVEEGGSGTTVNVLENDTDADGDVLSITGTPSADNGTVVDNGDGTLSYTPDAGFSGSDMITYQISDGTDTTTATLDVTVEAGNAAPVSEADAELFLDQGQTATTVDVLANDTDAENESLSITGIPSAGNGTVVANGDGTLSYTPDDGFFGTDVITYQITDGTNTITATLDVTVNERDYIVRGTDGDDSLDASYVDVDNDVVTDGDDTIEGLGGDDLLDGGAGADTLDGGDGSDTASYAGAAQAVVADLTGDSANTGDAAGDVYISIENLTGSAFADRLTGDDAANALNGAAGADTLTGGNGADSLLGGVGDDLLIGGAGANTLDGGDGFDAVSYAASGGSVTVNLSDTSQNAGQAANDSLTDIEGIIGSAFGDVLTGDAASNALSGGAGDDVLDGGAGADEIDGGADRDRLTYATAAAAVAVNLATGTSDQGDTIRNVEDLTGSLFHDTLDGSDEANRIEGLDGADAINGLGGNDALSGGAGQDTLNGGMGDDTLSGGDGADELNGGEGTDVASYAEAAEGLRIDLRLPWRSTGEADGDRFIHIEGLEGTQFNDRLYGDKGSNVLIGNGGADRLVGRRGDDTLDGGDGNDLLWGGSGQDDLRGGNGDDYLNGGRGNDVLSGGAGADRLIGGSGHDTADYSGSPDGVTIDLGGAGWGWWSQGPEASGGDATGDRLHSIENVTGSAHDDSLTGDSGANVLAGGAGGDTLTGGHGRDTFVFNTGDGADVVTDYDSGWQFLWWHIPGDTIQLDVDGIDDFGDLVAAANQTGRDVTLDFGDGDSLTLQNTHLSTLDQDGFIFV